jgi:hypothetical protein
MATLNDLAVSVIELGETLERVKLEIEAMNDKQPKVILTVEEAKGIWEILEDNENYFPEGFWEMADWLKNKIEQAEKTNA